MQSATAEIKEPDLSEKVKGAIAYPVLGAYGLFLIAVLKRPPFIPVEDFPFTAEMERDWKVVRSELDDLLENGPEVPPFVKCDPVQRRIWSAAGRVLRRWVPRTDPDQLDAERWRTFMFTAYGRDVPANRAYCPGTAALLDEVPNLFGAFFSVLKPGARLPTHVGFFPGAYRAHLALKIPEDGKAGFRVAGIERGWEEGKMFIFEHSCWHTAWNDSDEERAVLILDFERPMPWPWLTKVNHAIVQRVRSAAGSAQAVAAIDALTTSQERPAKVPVS